MTEREKMLAGEVYDACDAELLVDLTRNSYEIVKTKYTKK